MYRLEITELAQQDIENAFNYIAIQLDNPIAAKDFFSEIKKCYSYLRDNPYIYAKSNDLRLEKEGYRKAHIKNYLLMFKINETQKTVIIYRVFYGAMDYFSLL